MAAVLRKFLSMKKYGGLEKGRREDSRRERNETEENCGNKTI